MQDLTDTYCIVVSNIFPSLCRSFSKKFFDGIHHCFLKFTEKYELVMCYITLCLVLVEIPEPVVTINIVS